MDSLSLLLRCVPDTRRNLNVITPVPFGTTIDSGIAKPTRTIAAQFGEPEATRTLYQRTAVQTENIAGGLAQQSDPSRTALNCIHRFVIPSCIVSVSDADLDARHRNRQCVQRLDCR